MEESIARPDAQSGVMLEAGDREGDFTPRDQELRSSSRLCDHGVNSRFKAGAVFGTDLARIKSRLYRRDANDGLSLIRRNGARHRDSGLLQLLR